MMISRITRKRSSKAGESIGETLVALLISALALVMLAGAVSAGMRVVTRSKDKMEVYYKVNNAVVAHEDNAPEINGTAVNGFSKGTISVNITNLLPSSKTMPQIDCWKNEVLGSIQVIVYSVHKT